MQVEEGRSRDGFVCEVKDVSWSVGSDIQSAGCVMQRDISVLNGAVSDIGSAPTLR